MDLYVLCTHPACRLHISGLSCRSVRRNYRLSLGCAAATHAQSPKTAARPSCRRPDSQPHCKGAAPIGEVRLADAELTLDHLGCQPDLATGDPAAAGQRLPGEQLLDGVPGGHVAGTDQITDRSAGRAAPGGSQQPVGCLPRPVTSSSIPSTSRPAAISGWATSFAPSAGPGILPRRKSPSERESASLPCHASSWVAACLTSRPCASWGTQWACGSASSLVMRTPSKKKTCG
jgi:hypothetical protein